MANMTLVQGHRGNIFVQPENTLAGFASAADAGADAVELDVFMTADGAAVCFHGGGKGDAEVGDCSELCEGEGNIQEMTLAQAQALRFKGGAFDCPAERCAGEGVGVPTLAEALALCQQRGLGVTVELKGAGTEQAALDALRERGMLGPGTGCSVSSFDHERVARAVALGGGAGAVPASLLFGSSVPPDFVARARAAGASQVDVRYDTLAPALVAEARAAGLRIMAWFRGPCTLGQMGVDEEKEFAQIAAMGPDVICTNRPAALRALLSERAVSAGGVLMSAET